MGAHPHQDPHKSHPVKKNTSPKHAHIMLTPLNPTFIHMYSKTGVCRVYIIVLISAQKHCGYLLELPVRQF